MTWTDRSNDWAASDWAGYTWRSPDLSPTLWGNDTPAAGGMWQGTLARARPLDDQPGGLNLAGLIAIETLARLEPAVVTLAMQRAADPAFIEEARRLFDTNEDGALALPELAQTLFKLRDIVARDPRAWVSGEKAAAIERAIVDALNLLGQPSRAAAPELR
jgi:hypothetical protein